MCIFLQSLTGIYWYVYLCFQTTRKLCNYVDICMFLRRSESCLLIFLPRTNVQIIVLCALNIFKSAFYYVVYVPAMKMCRAFSVAPLRRWFRPTVLWITVAIQITVSKDLCVVRCLVSCLIFGSQKKIMLIHDKLLTIDLFSSQIPWTQLRQREIIHALWAHSSGLQLCFLSWSYSLKWL